MSVEVWTERVPCSWHWRPGPWNREKGPWGSTPADWSCQLQSRKVHPGPGWQSINVKGFIVLYSLAVLYVTAGN